MKIEQCLFGYDDGHRLLASSIRLGEQTSFLTEVSDLAPGAMFGGSSGYWTGLPLPRLRKYVLMKTWPAPEMPRPGCVWTHALLFNPDDLGHIEDLSTLEAFVRRPLEGERHDAYDHPITAPPKRTETLRASPLRVTDLRNLVLSLYGSNGDIVQAESPGCLDEAIFAVWSQQWPRLRRNFSFQTAASRERSQATKNRFDISLVLNGKPSEDADRNSMDLWAQAAIDDILRPAESPLRNFLWRYGIDVKKQRGSFRPLCEVAILSFEKPSSGKHILDILSKHFPTLQDAFTLKQDLTDGVIFSEYHLDFIETCLINGSSSNLPAPSRAGIERLSTLWPNQADRLLNLAELSASASGDVANSIFDVISAAISDEVIWDVTHEYPQIQIRVVRARPDLLASANIERLGSETILSLIDALPVRTPVVRDLIPRLLLKDSQAISEEIIKQFPEDVAIQLIRSIDSKAYFGENWISSFRKRLDLLLDPNVIGSTQHTSTLYTLSEMLGWRSDRVMRAGMAPWLTALKDIREDLPEDKRAILFSFLVSLAISDPSEQARRVIEKFFAHIHTLILNSHLPWQARDLLSPILADVGWLKSWDVGLRLRLSVAQTYIANRYPTESFAGLLKQRKTREMLADAAYSLPGGKKYAQAIYGK